MVNTFISFFDPKLSLKDNFLQAARLLDNVRLPNQRREALMVLRSIRKLKGLSEVFKCSIPSDPYQWYEWIRMIIKVYQKTSKEKNQVLLFQDQKWQWVPSNLPIYDIHDQKYTKWMSPHYRIQAISFSLSPSPIYSFDLQDQRKLNVNFPKPDEMVYFPIIDRIISRSQCLFSNDMDMGLGYIYHPCILQWLGYEEALKLYLNCCIEVTLERGFRNEMSLEPLHLDLDKITVPIWLYDQENIVLRHRAMLLMKELDRNEKPWYQLNDLFVQTYSRIDLRKYFWPFSPKCDSEQGIADIEKKYQQFIGS